jgi:hypothetical protein
LQAGREFEANNAEWLTVEDAEPDPDGPRPQLIQIGATLMADDPDWVREFRRVLNAAKLPEYMRDLAEAVPTSVVKDLVSDFRSYNPHPAQDPSAKVVPQGAGRVIDGNDTVASTGTGGWVDAPKVDNWRPPGLEHIDRMMDAADLQDRIERVRQLGQAKALVQAEAEIKRQEETSKKGKKP